VHLNKNQKEVQQIMYECSVRIEGVWVKNYIQNEEEEEEEGGGGGGGREEEKNETGMKQDEVRDTEFITRTEKMYRF